MDAIQTRQSALSERSARFEDAAKKVVETFHEVQEKSVHDMYGRISRALNDATPEQKMRK